MKRLQELWNIDECAFPESLEAIALCIIHTNCVHVRRKRGREAWSNGGTEKEKGIRGIQEEKIEPVRLSTATRSWQQNEPVIICHARSDSARQATLGRPKLHRPERQDGVPLANSIESMRGKY